jgi:hypothetical protein
MTAANETTVASVDNSEWHRHKKEHQATAGIGMKNLQSRISELTQEREDLKIEVDVLRSAYHPDENMLELIRVRQELVKSKKYSQTLKLIGEQQSSAIRQLKKEANALKKQQAGGGDSTLRKQLAEMEDAVRLLDQQREEEAAARQAAEEEAQRRKEDFEKLEQEHNALLVSDCVLPVLVATDRRLTVSLAVFCRTSSMTWIARGRIWRERCTRWRRKETRLARSGAVGNNKQRKSRLG